MIFLRSKKITSEILKLAIPAIAGVSSQMVISLVDTAMVGRLGNSKPSLAAMGLGVLATWAIISFFSSLSAGTHILIARKVGEKDCSGCETVLNSSLIFGFFLGLVVAILIFFGASHFTYLIAVDPEVKFLSGEYISYRFLGLPFFLMVVSYRGFFFGIGHTKIFMISGILTNLLNIFLNWILVFGNLGFPQLGLKGSAIASSISTCFDFFFYLYVTFLSFYRKTYLRNGKLKLDFNIIYKIVRLSLPVSFQNIFILVGFLTFIAFTGLIGTLEQAASQTVVSSIFISVLPCFGFGIAVQTLVGNYMGFRKFKFAGIFALETAKLAFIFTSIIGFIFLVFPEIILNITTNNTAVIQRAKPALQIAGLSQMLYGFSIVFANALQAAGKTFYVMMAEIISNWLVFIPIAYFFGIILDLGFVGIWLSLPSYIIVYAFLILIKFRKGDWKTNKL